MRTNIIIGATAVLALALSGCGKNKPEDARDDMNDKLEKVEDKMDDAERTADTRKEWVQERNDVLDELRGLRNDIDRELAKHNEKLAGTDLKASERHDHEAMKAEYEKEKGIVEGLIKDVEAANDQTWATVKADTRRSTDDVKAWWTRTKEKIDRKTDADKDNDGH